MQNKYFLPRNSWFLLFIFSMFAGLIYRSYIVNYTHSLLAGCKWCFIMPVWMHDILFLSVIFAATGIALIFKSKIIRTLIGVLIIPVIFFFWLDVTVYKTLNYRVRLEDAILFSKETNAIFTFAQALKSSPKDLFPLIMGLVNIISGILFLLFAPRSLVACRWLLGTALLLCSIHFLAIEKDPDYVFNDTVMNFMEINYPSGVDKKYTSNQKNNKENLVQKIKISTQNTSKNNVIILVVESLSGYHLNTLLPSGKIYTPFLDRLSKENSYFSNFFANGFTTDGGLISLLTGRAPVPSIGRYRSVDAFRGFECIDDSLPKFMKSRNYETSFFSNSSLEFTNLGGWAKSIGFDYVEGPDHSFYKKWEKGLFGAVEDRALFSRFINWIDNQENAAGKPYMAVLMTHSTHPPFVDPITKSNIETEVYQYMDRSVEKFFHDLTSSGYFSQGGILLITGDHRGYTPISLEEQTYFGETARARIPFIAVGDTGLAKGKIEMYAQQVDLLNSMKAILGKEGFFIPSNRGVFLGPTTRESAFVLHASGRKRDQIKVFYPRSELGIIKLNGDKTSWQGGKSENWKDILQAIADDRTHRGDATINYIDYLYKVTFDQKYGAGKFATGSSCTTIYPAPNY